MVNNTNRSSNGKQQQQQQKKKKKSSSDGEEDGEGTSGGGGGGGGGGDKDGDADPYASDDTAAYKPVKMYEIGRVKFEQPDWTKLKLLPPQVNKKLATHCWALPEFDGSRLQVRLYIKKAFCPVGFKPGFEEDEENKPSLAITHPRFKELFEPLDDFVEPTLKEMFTGVDGFKGRGPPTVYGSMYRESFTDDGKLRDGIMNAVVKLDENHRVMKKNGKSSLKIYAPNGKAIDPNKWRKMNRPFRCDCVVKLISARRASEKYSLKWEVTVVRVHANQFAATEDRLPDDGYEEGDELLAKKSGEEHEADEEYGGGGSGGGGSKSRGRPDWDPENMSGGGGGGGGGGTEESIRDDGGGVETAGDPDDSENPEREVPPEADDSENLLSVAPSEDEHHPVEDDGAAATDGGEETHTADDGAPEDPPPEQTDEDVQ